MVVKNSQTTGRGVLGVSSGQMDDGERAVEFFMRQFCTILGSEKMPEE